MQRIEEKSPRSELGWAKQEDINRALELANETKETVWIYSKNGEAIDFVHPSA